MHMKMFCKCGITYVEFKSFMKDKFLNFDKTWDKYQKILYNRKVFSILVDLGLKILPCGGGSVLVVTQREGFLPFLFL